LVFKSHDTPEQSNHLIVIHYCKHQLMSREIKHAQGGHESLQNRYGMSADQAASSVLLERNFVDKHTYVTMKILDILVFLHGKITYIINISTHNKSDKVWLCKL
jgi:hypothetical protein